jgi:hypothetical protein
MMNNPTVIRGLRAIVLAGTALAASAAAGSVSMSEIDATRVWEFRVLLDGDEIGYHRFRLVNEGESARLISEAAFSVQFLFIDAYRYRHENEEVWRGDCLQAIDARTKINGESLTVRGERREDGFVVSTDDEREVLEGCVMSFAYWNPEFLDQDRLLNAQNGEYVAVTIEPQSEERLDIGGREVDAIRYSLDAGEMAMRLWYTPDREWLALESKTKGGRLLRYEPVSGPMLAERR